ncbi:hypothetical protein OYC61_012735 [Alcaligenes nematophilus]|uniref:DUF2335 domain-containing protein n=1 Tax=Alcaligenes nematophilus TaxID=2994643 RepID=A0ABU3MUX6_9BURK|nr:hypothetical protein [Alcaligenes nematophilus]MDT8505165.1 hypothetical protein [Alcaligenes nematophilus]
MSSVKRDAEGTSGDSSVFPKSAEEWEEVFIRESYDPSQLELPGFPNHFEEVKKLIPGGGPNEDLPPDEGPLSSFTHLSPVKHRKPNEDELKRQDIADREANRGLRERYADKAYQLAHFCLVWWMFMLFMQGMLTATNQISLWSDKVLVAVTAGVTASVLAAFLGVIRGLFPSDKNGINGRDDK